MITQRALILVCPLRSVRLIPLVVEYCGAFHLIGLTCSSAAALLETGMTSCLFKDQIQTPQAS